MGYTITIDRKSFISPSNFTLRDLNQSVIMPYSSKSSDASTDRIPLKEYLAGNLIQLPSPFPWADAWTWYGREEGGYYLFAVRPEKDYSEQVFEKVYVTLDGLCYLREKGMMLYSEGPSSHKICPQELKWIEEGRIGDD